jgi:NAD-dependent deacetylase
VVYPAAGLIDYYKGDKLVLINRDATPVDRRANLLVQGSIGQILGALK